jgi:hypothetical protein
MTKGQEIPKEHQAKLGFHGTDYDFTGKVLPRGKLDHPPHYSISGDDDTYFLPADGSPEQNRQNEAGAWGWTSPDEFAKSAGPDRPRVHLTRPIGPQHIDRNLNYDLGTRSEIKTKAAVAPEQEIVDTHWGPPATEAGTHVNQTLPHVNWHQFGGANWTTHVPGGNGWKSEAFPDKSPGDIGRIKSNREYYTPEQAKAYYRGGIGTPEKQRGIGGARLKKPTLGQDSLFG